MNDFTCQIISPTGEVFELPYYKLEDTCRILIEKFLNDTGCSSKELLNRKRNFFRFQKQYKTFSPYFDYLFLELGYTLKNPYLISNSILTFHEEDGILCYYAKYLGNLKELSTFNRNALMQPLFVQGLECNILKYRINGVYEELPECFIDESLQALAIKGPLDLHNFWARMWLHPLLMRHLSVCEDYVAHQKEDGDFVCEDQASMLQQYYNWIRFASTTIGSVSGSNYYATYYWSRLSLLQQEFLTELKNQKLLLSRYSINLE